ncbi:uncharacterized protein V6R79_005136 [Siganus canaliculatus]
MCGHLRLSDPLRTAPHRTAPSHHQHKTLISKDDRKRKIKQYRFPVFSSSVLLTHASGRVPVQRTTPHVQQIRTASLCCVQTARVRGSVFRPPRASLAAC